MKILLLNQFYPPDVAPTGQYLHDLATFLVKKGHEVRVICSRKSYNGEETFPAKDIRDGVHIKRLYASGFGRGSTSGRLADYASFYSALAASLLMLRPRPDIVLALTTPPYLGVIAKFFAGLYGYRHTHWIMDLYPDVLAAHRQKQGGFIYRILQFLTRWQFRGTSSTIVLGPFMEKKISNYMAQPELKKLQSCFLWSDATFVDQKSSGNTLRRERGWQEQELVLLYSGNMGLGHRFAEFLAAARQLGAQGPLWAFSGGGKRRIEIENFIRENPGSRIQLLQSGSPCLLQVDGCRLSLRGELAMQILVRPVAAAG